MGRPQRLLAVVFVLTASLPYLYSDTTTEGLYGGPKPEVSELGQEPRSLAPYLSPRHFFGAELRHWREQRGLSQDQLGRAIHVSGDLIGKVEKATRWPQVDLARACDAVLRTDGALERLWPLVDAQRDQQLSLEMDVDNSGGDADKSAVQSVGPSSAWMMTFQVDEEGNVWAQVDRRTLLIGSAVALIGPGATESRSAVTGADHRSGFDRFVTERWPGLRLSQPVPDYGVDWKVLVPGGRAMGGTELSVQVHPGRVEPGGSVQVTIDEPSRVKELRDRAGRTFLAVADTRGEKQRYFLISVGDLRARSRAGGRGPTDIRIPEANELDDLTYGIVWAAANLDDALRADDRLLEETRADLAVYEGLSSSAVSREVAAGLSPVAHMWLGSDFCARHILRTLPELPEIPAFWTREQRGEEASAWLLFDHKYRYLRQTMQLVGGEVVRAFCIPEQAVTSSARHERILLFLAVALMESLGIHVQITAEPDFSSVEGFVLAPGRKAIIANWVRGDGMWHVDVSDRTRLVRRFTDIAGDVAAGSIIAGQTPAWRLQALASYLELDWAWLTRRCAELGRSGTGSLVDTRSRLVSSAGVDAACAFVGSLPASR